jgi:hypothetical protein
VLCRARIVMRDFWIVGQALLCVDLTAVAIRFQLLGVSHAAFEPDSLSVQPPSVLRMSGRTGCMTDDTTACRLSRP